MNKVASNVDHSVYFSYSTARAQSGSWKQVNQLLTSALRNTAQIPNVVKACIIMLFLKN